MKGEERMKFGKVIDIVKMVMENAPETRDDDYLLWLAVIDICAAEDGNPTYTYQTTISQFLRKAIFSKYPHFNTVSRSRRKVQRKYPELKATPEMRYWRAVREAQYGEMAKDG
jgi:hypothetical protein